MTELIIHTSMRTDLGTKSAAERESRAKVRPCDGDDGAPDADRRIGDGDHNVRLVLELNLKPRSAGVHRGR